MTASFLVPILTPHGHLLFAPDEDAPVLAEALQSRLTQSKQSLQDFLKRRHPAWNLVGRVHFNLAENRGDEAAPFAFIATYTTRLSAQAKAQHLPLAQALREYSDAKNKARLLSLLVPVQRAAEHCAWLRAMVDAKDLVARAGAGLPLAKKGPAAGKVLDDAKLAAIFGIEIMEATVTDSRVKAAAASKKAPASKKSPAGKKLLMRRRKAALGKKRAA